jgi:hypothetical protein
VRKKLAENNLLPTTPKLAIPVFLPLPVRTVSDGFRLFYSDQERFGEHAN